jgi:hypothetical protein
MTLLKKIFIFCLIISASAQLDACRNCDSFSSKQKDFTDTMKINLSIDTFFLDLGNPDPDNLPITYEIQYSDITTDSMFVTARLRGYWLYGDSTSSDKYESWRHDTLVAIFNYRSYATMHDSSLSKAIEASAFAPCGDPGAPSFWIEHAVIQIPRSKKMFFINYGGWK